MIGNEFCNITSLTSTQLLCVPPAHQPPPNDDDAGDLPQVSVLVTNVIKPCFLRRTVPVAKLASVLFVATHFSLVLIYL
jgi:hypothetical protein